MVEYLSLPVLFFLSAFFSSSETVLFSLTAAQRDQIAERSPKTGELIARCLADKAVLFSTILVGNTFVNFAIAAIGYRLFRAWIPGQAFLAVPVMTVLLLVFGEITPKRLALRHAAAIAPVCARLLAVWRFVLTPINVVLRFTSRAFAPALARERRALSDEELVSVMESAAEHGEISAADAGMIEGVLRLSELSANDEMTPRVDIVGYDADLLGEPSAESVARFAASGPGHRFVPVFRRSRDSIEKILEVATGRVEDALFVPETVALDDLLQTFAMSGKPMAVVLDEYGGTAGIITPNDILELIVGPAVFGDAGVEPAFRKTGDSRWEIDGRVSLDEINRELDLELAAEDADRLAGWVQFHAERLPHVGQEVVADGCRATVRKRRHRRVTLVELEVLERPAADTDEQILADTDEAVERTEEDAG